MRLVDAGFPLEYIRRLDDFEIDAYMDAIGANEYRKQMIYVPMSKEQATKAKAAMYNCLLIENPIFSENEALIKASQDQYLAAKEQRLKTKDIPDAKKRDLNSP